MDCGGPPCATPRLNLPLGPELSAHRHVAIGRHTPFPFPAVFQLLHRLAPSQLVDCSADLPREVALRSDVLTIVFCFHNEALQPTPPRGVCKNSFDISARALCVCPSSPSAKALVDLRNTILEKVGVAGAHQLGLPFPLPALAPRTSVQGDRCSRRTMSCVCV